MFQGLRRALVRSNLGKLNIIPTRWVHGEKKGKTYAISYDPVNIPQVTDPANHIIYDGTKMPIEPSQYTDKDPHYVPTIDELPMIDGRSPHNEALREAPRFIVPPYAPEVDDVRAKEWLNELLNYVWAPPLQPHQTIPSRPRMRLIDDVGRASGRGGRKSSSAEAWVKPGTGKIFINGLPYTEYFDEFDQRSLVGEPFYITGTVSQFDVWATVQGGGKRGQAGAVKHAIAVALQNFDPEFRPTLKVNKLLTRDQRVVERKHTGKRKARKSFTWVKR